MLAFAAVESASRHARPWQGSLWYQFWRRPTPYTMFSHRDDPAVGPKAPSEWRVFMSGGSTVRQGDPPLPELVQRELRRRGRRQASVYNFGVSAQVSGQELARLVFQMVDLNPDLVVFYGGGNDINLAWEADPRHGYPYDFVLHERHPFRLPPDEYPALALLAYESAVLRRLVPGWFRGRFASFEPLRAAAGFGKPEWRRKVAGNYVENLLKAQRISEAYGSRFVAMFQPLAVYKEPPVGSEPRPRGGRYAVYARLARKDVREAAARHAEELAFADLSDALDGLQEETFATKIHLTPRGNEVMAAKICDALGALGVLPWARARAGKRGSAPFHEENKTKP